MPDPFNPAVDDEDDVDEETNDLLYLKYCFEGAASLSDLAAGMRSLADELDLRAADGWSLAGPIEGGHARLVRKGA